MAEVPQGYNLRIRVETVEQRPLPAGEEHFDDIHFMQVQPGQTGQHSSTPGDAVDVPAHPANCEPFQFNPFAPAFVPTGGNILAMNEFVQDLHAVWQLEAFQWEGEEASCLFVTWCVDHLNEFPHGTRPRVLRLYPDFTTWERDLRTLWRDELNEDTIVEFHLVRPTPPHLERDIVGHIIVVQNPGAQTVTSLVTLIDQTLPASRGRLRRMAITTHEHIRLEMLIDVLGYTHICVPTDSPQVCRAWYMDERLRFGRPLQGRDGYGITIHTQWRSRIQHDEAVQLQISTNHLSAGGRERLTHGTVAQAHGPRTTLILDHLIEHHDAPEEDLNPAMTLDVAVRLRSGCPSLLIPPYVEATSCHDAHEINSHLAAWNIQCQVFQFGGHDEYLCLPNAWTTEQQHIVYCTREGTDPDAAILHTWQTVDGQPTTLAHMKVLYKLGFLKTAIVHDEILCPGLSRVVFVHLQPTMEQRTCDQRLPTPWPSPQPVASSRAPPYDRKRWQATQQSCMVGFGIDITELDKLFQPSSFPLFESLEGFELPPSTAKWASTLQPLGDKAIHNLDRIVVYADGSSMSALRHQPPLFLDEKGLGDTWAFIAIGEEYQDDAESNYYLIGWQAQPVIYDTQSSLHIGTSHVGAEAAEREALFWAMTWRVSINVAVPTTFCTDSSVTKGQASGETGANDLCESFRLLRGIAQTLQAMLPADQLRFQHVLGHSQDPVNDFVDFAAKAERTKSHYFARPCFSVMELRKIIPFLWMFFQQDTGLPTLCANGFFAPPPALPCHEVPATKTSPATKHVRHDVQVSAASANVQSLYTGEQGHPGKLQFLRQQFIGLHLNFMGLQEARSTECCTCVDEVLRFASGADKGHLGVELWINLACPIGYADAKPKHLQKSDIVVLHTDPRILLARVDHALLQTLLLVIHAPQSGCPRDQRSSWWERLDAILTAQKTTAQEPMIVLMDCNAASGPCQHPHIGPDGDRTTANTEFLLTFLQTQDICLPSTFPVHEGDRMTWHSPDGQHECRIDFVGVPCGWLETCTHSCVLTELDLGALHIDHQAVALQLQWTDWIEDRRRQPHAQVAGYDRASLAKDGHCPTLAEIKIGNWSQDIESQVEAYNSAVIGVIEKQHPRQRTTGKKPYITPEIWELRSRKIAIGDILRTLRRRLRLELLFLTWRTWRGTMRHNDLRLALTYRASLLASSVKLTATYHAAAHRLRSQLKQTKFNFVAAHVKNLPVGTPSGMILKEIHRLQGPTNPKKIKRTALPRIRREDGSICPTPAAMVDRWVEFFGAMEGGDRMPMADLRTHWRNNLRQFQQEDFDMVLQDLPTLCDLERAFARAQPGKAIGHDHLPPEICKSNAVSLARLSYTQMMKLAIHGHEALTHKGGKLVQAHKGKGPTDRCSSYRSLLISSHQGKILHRALRQKQTNLYERYLQRQQLGGRKQVPVNLGLHHLRAHMRVQNSRKSSCGILYLDLKEAFYRVLRPLTLESPWSDQEISTLAERLGLGPGVMAELHEHLRAPCAVAQAELPRHVRNHLTALHSDTWFFVHGQADVCRTTLGSRPGDCFADTVFGYLWARVLRQIEAQLVEHDILDTFLDQPGSGLFGHSPQQDQPSTHQSYLGPCWMDDLAICVSSATADGLINRLSTMINILMETCLSHAMTPNVEAGKTELMLNLRGHRSRHWKKHLHGPQGDQQLRVIGEHQCFAVRLTGRYRHLGGVVHHTGSQRFEAKQRLAVAHQTFTQNRRLLFRNKHIPGPERRQIFDAIIMSGFCYGSESWTLQDYQSKEYVHSGIMKLYRRLSGKSVKEPESDEAILVSCDAPSPTELLRRARLRYLCTLYHGASSSDWGIITHDREWLDLLQDDCVWLWQQLRHCSSLQDPRDHFPAWEYILRNHPSYWKRLVKRGIAHAVLQRRNQHIVSDLHGKLFRRLCEEGQLSTPEPIYEKPFDMEQYYGCMHCGLRCASKGGEGAHFFKKHGVIAAVRRLCDTSQCPHCLKEYHTRGKLQRHLQWSTICRDSLNARRYNLEPTEGIGSLAQRAEQRQHDGLLPPLQAQGPKMPDRPLRARDLEHSELIEEWVKILEAGGSRPGLLASFEKQIQATVISWTQCKITLQVFQEEYNHEMEEITGVERAMVKDIVGCLLDPQHWPFLHTRRTRSFQPDEALAHYELWCQRLCVDEPHQQAWTPLHAPRPIGKERIVLHAFAGRRRLGDYQWYLESLMSEASGLLLHVVSIDIIIDRHYGDLSRADVQDYWLAGIRAGWVHSFLGGPPCCTWSKARGVMLPGQDPCKGPRPVRSADHLWGLPSLALRELRQILDGNVLLGFCILALGELALQARSGIVEHPAEPEASEAPSIWKLPIMQLLFQLPGMRRLKLSQGLLGADSSKPTELIALNLPTLPAAIVQWRLTPDVPRHTNIGRDATGQFRTAQLKEYPPAFCGAMAQATFAAISGEVTTDVQIDHHFLSRCVAMDQGIQGDYIGPDFAAV